MASGTFWITPGFKKSLRASEQDRADVARRRRQWQERQGTVCASRLIFIDETPGSSPTGAKIA
jgi:hypothetical protein